MQEGVKTTDFPQQTQASEADCLLANIAGKTSQISLLDMLGNVPFSALETSEKTIVGAINGLVTNMGSTTVWKGLEALDVTQADGNVIVDYGSLSPQPKEFCVRYGKVNGSLIYGGGAVTTPNLGGDPFWLPVYVDSLRHIGNAYIFVNHGIKTITLSFNDLPGAAGAPATAKFRIFYR